MLVLTRRANQSIHLLEPGIVVTVLSSRRGAIRLGISAPDDVSVLRSELVEETPASERRSLAARIRKEGKCRA